jgi:transcriptional regulator with XRE-family HTH domain
MAIRLREAVERYNERRQPDLLPMTQARLAEAVGTTQALVSKHMNGHITPSIRILSAYARALDVPIEALLEPAA